MGWWDPAVAVAGLLVGVVVGLTGMGGGALMTPVLVLFFGVPPLSAVSSDVVASFFMKPIGGLVHLRRGTVHLPLVGWLCVGSVPSAFVGVLLLRLVGSRNLEKVLLLGLGSVLVLASVAMTMRSYLKLRARARLRRSGEPETEDVALATVPVRRGATILVGVVGGLVVGMTSVGAGSLIIVSLLLLYPSIKTGQLVGTDLVQAIPLVASASIGHLLFGDFSLGLTGSVLVGAIPGVWLGARVSSHAPGGLVRRALAVVLLASGVKLLGAPPAAILGVVAAALVGGAGAWAGLRRWYGEPALAWRRHRGRPVGGEELSTSAPA
jgi:uncharacterized membrane protein YfcA